MSEALDDKARKARNLVTEAGIAARETVGRNAKAAGVSLKPSEEYKAADMIRPTIAAERARTANRATFIANRENQKEKEARIAAAAGNVPAKKAPTTQGTQTGHHVTDSKNHTKTVK